MDLNASQMLKVRAFGTLSVVDATGESVRAIASQRRLLALLALLASAGDSAVSRDRVAALLWPESTSDRAGQSITQAMYSARRILRIDDLFITAGGLRLNPDRIISDVAEFEAGLARNDLRSAVAAYSGAFLDGFFLSGAMEFEQWASSARRRYDDAYVAALRRLAESDERAGNARAALEWWKRVAAARPLDGSAAVALMNALASTGDRAGALGHARIHTELLRQELEIDPDPAVLMAAERLQRLVVPVADAPTVERLHAPPTSTDVPEAMLVGTVGQSATSPRRRRAIAGWAAAAALVIASAMAVYFATSRLRPIPVAPAAPRVSRERIVVAPFRVSGASASLSYLRDGMVELLSERLADTSARSLDVGGLLGAWHRAAGSGSADLSQDSIVHLAAALGADRVVVGSVVGTAGHVVLSASEIAVANHRPGRTAIVDGASDSMNVLVDRLAAGLLIHDAGEDAVLSIQTTRSLSALRAFLDGQAAFRRGAYDDALHAYAAALERDSSFALAALQMVRAGDRLQAIALRGAPLDLAWRTRKQLPKRERALLEALAGPNYPRPATDAEQLAAWERLVALDPDRADAWYELGARLFHAGGAIGLPDARARSIAALQRALSIDASYAPAQRLLVQLAATDVAHRLPLPSIEVLRSSGPLAPAAAWRVASARGDRAVLESLRDTMAALGPANLRVIAQTSQFDVIGLDDGRRALDILRNRPARPSERLEQADAQHSLAILQGRLRDAVAAANRLSDLQPGTAAGLRLQILDALYGDSDERIADDAARQLASEELEGTTTPTRIPGRMADICVLGQWRIAHGDAAGARRDVRLLNAAEEHDAARGSTAASLIAATPPATCALLLEASLAILEHRGDTRQLLVRLDSAALLPPVAGDASMYAPIVVARLHAKVGDVGGALRAVRRRVYLMGWPRYLATALREEATYAELVGDREKERSALERFVVLRQQGDSTLAAQAAAARRRLREIGN